MQAVTCCIKEPRLCCRSGFRWVWLALGPGPIPAATLFPLGKDPEARSLQLCPAQPFCGPWPPPEDAGGDVGGDSWASRDPLVWQCLPPEPAGGRCSRLSLSPRSPHSPGSGATRRDSENTPCEAAGPPWPLSGSAPGISNPSSQTLLADLGLPLASTWAPAVILESGQALSRVWPLPGPAGGRSSQGSSSPSQRCPWWPAGPMV